MAKVRKRKVNKTQVVTAGTNITFEEPKSSRQPKEPVAKVVIEEINPARGFIGFLREHAIVGLSIGFIVGNQMSAFVRILVDNVIDPLTKLLFGTALSQRTLTLHFRDETAIFGWGIVVYNLIIIILLLVIIFVAIKVFALDKLKPLEEKGKK